MKRTQIKAILKKGNVSPFNVAKLNFNTIWSYEHLQKPILSEDELQSLLYKLSPEESADYRYWREWFKDILEVYNQANDHYNAASSLIFRLLWFIEKDLNQNYIQNLYKAFYPQIVTAKQYQDIKKKDRQDRLKAKLPVIYCIAEIIENRLPKEGLSLEDYVYRDPDEDFNPEDRQLAAGLFKKVVKKLLPLIEQGKVSVTYKSQLVKALRSALKKAPDQIADILLGSLYNDVEVPVKILETSTIAGEQFYRHFKECRSRIDTFYPEHIGGYAIAQDSTSSHIDEKGYYNSFDLFDKQSGLDWFATNGGMHTFFSIQLRDIDLYIRSFQFKRMVLDVLTGKLNMPLNQDVNGKDKDLEAYRNLLFTNLDILIGYNRELSKLITDKGDKAIEDYYPNQMVVDYCIARIEQQLQSHESAHSNWFNDIKDVYLKESFKTMPQDRIDWMLTIGNKAQRAHFSELVKK